MTDQELNEAVTDDKLNELVARKLGYSVEMIDGYHSKVLGQTKSGQMSCDLKSYSSSIEAAWEIVEKFPFVDGKAGWADTRFDFFLVKESDGWRSGWMYWPDGDLTADISQKADTAPLAICKAFLKLP